MTRHVCPECRDGKPWGCVGWAIDDDDNMVECQGPEAP